MYVYVCTPSCLPQAERVAFATLSSASSAQTRAEVVHKFMTDPSVKVFLLTIRAAGAGLTLTAASQVFMLDPCLNPAAAAQAMSRVHRIGQRSEVHVHHLVMTNTVEEKILAWRERVGARTKQSRTAELGELFEL